jgi:hypothetical protein
MERLLEAVDKGLARDEERQKETKKKDEKK